ncbi:hypothetical protein C8J56DRAFT_911713 [Mycena floridula]|nr:hypothetical protein C8J56DRAFT_911713 [Mycena floridula]
MSQAEFDCIVVGSGHAGSCAALSAAESGCKKVLIIDKCPEAWAGGNGKFTAGAFRTVHGGYDDLAPAIVASAPDGRTVEMTPYSRDNFFQDLMRLSQGKSDTSLAQTIVDNSRETLGWLSSIVKVPFVFSFNRQAYEVDGIQKFWGGMCLAVQNGGKGLISAHQAALAQAGVEIWYDSPLIELLVEQGAVTGVLVRKSGVLRTLKSTAVILAAGGFEANVDLRIKHLGPQWEKAKVRGTPYNTGECFAIAVAAGARLTSGFEGCHSTAWDANAANDAGDPELTNQKTKSGYPLGIMVNCHGNRFVDEGEDFRNFTYAKFGRAILEQPGGFAFQVWDAKVLEYLRKEEYGNGIVEKIFAENPEALADKLLEKGLEDKVNFVATVRRFDEAVVQHRASNPSCIWDPSVKDGLSTLNLDLPKSNWALTVDVPPLLAVKVACGITFTFGGLAIDPETAGVLSDITGKPIEGLFCAGEMVGSLFYHNYPGGSGLTAGAVWGRKAGYWAAERMRRASENDTM